ncbi:MAG: hypothetical protein J6U49_02620 [Alistipes sp.]|nr:hypothetical protein [Alistipes sp.]
MERRILTTEQVARLKEPLPAKALKPHPSKAYLTTINSIYVTERLNDVFGVGSWQTQSEIVENTQKMIVVKTTLTIPEYGISYECYGGNDNADRGDAYKGAVTDALTKICSWLGIGAEVWKNEAGKAQPKVQPQPQPKPAPKPQAPAENPDLIVALQEVKEAQTVADLSDVKKRWRDSLGLNNEFVDALTKKYNAIINK